MTKEKLLLYLKGKLTTGASNFGISIPWFKITIIAALILFIILFFFVFNGVSYISDYFTSRAIEQTRKELETKYNSTIKEMNNKLEIVNNKLSISEKSRLQLINKSKELELKLSKIKLPASNAEIRERFNNLGYNPK